MKKHEERILKMVEFANERKNWTTEEIVKEQNERMQQEQTPNTTPDLMIEELKAALNKNQGINEVKKAVKELASKLNVTIICEKHHARIGAVDYKFYATNLLPSTNKAVIGEITMYSELGKKAYSHQVERLLEQIKKEVKINREYPNINIESNGKMLAEKHGYNKDLIAKILIEKHQQGQLSLHQWTSIYDAALVEIITVKGGISWETVDYSTTQNVEEEIKTTEKGEQNVSRETTPAPKKYYKAFIYNPNKKYLGDFRGNHKYYNGGQFSSKKGFCVCNDPKLCVGFMECHLEEGEELEIYEVQALNQQPSNTATELVFKTITLVRRLRPGKDF